MSTKEALENICSVAEEMVSMLPDDPTPDDLSEELYEKLRSKCDELQQHKNALGV